MFIHSRCNHAISFCLDSGQIYAINHGPRRGDKAISLIGQITGGSYRFDESSPNRLAQDLPPTAEILGRLKTSQDTAKIPTSSSSAVGADSVSAEQKQRICQELKNLLLEHLGPIAEMVFDDTVDETGDFYSSPERTQVLIDKLAVDIGDPAEIAQFSKEANKVISKMLGS